MKAIKTINESFSVISKMLLSFSEVCTQIDKNFLSICFKEFPYGACGDSCLVFGKYLLINYEIDPWYIVGTISNDNEYSTHAWLKIEDLILDPTFGQFNNNHSQVYFGIENDFYRNYNETSKIKISEKLNNRQPYLDFEQDCNTLHPLIYSGKI